MSHTEGKCTCHISYYPKPDHIVYCPLHKAAPDLYEALEYLTETVARLNGYTIDNSESYAMSLQAIAKAKPVTK